MTDAEQRQYDAIWDARKEYQELLSRYNATVESHKQAADVPSMLAGMLDQIRSISTVTESGASLAVNQAELLITLQGRVVELEDRLEKLEGK
jgi:hypothetical protein